MRTRPARCSAVLTLLFACVACAQDVPAISLQEYKSQLTTWSQTVEGLKDHPEQAPQVRAQVPRTYKVNAGEKTFDVSNEWLNQGLMQFIASKPERKADALRRMQDHFHQAQVEADLFNAPVTTDSARQKVNEILERREFSRVHGPSDWDIWLEKTKWAIVRFIDRLFRRVPSPNHGGQLLVWIVIAVALCVAAIWLKRTAQEKLLDLGQGPVQFAPSQRNWRTWLAQARAAAQESRWRDAVHLAYWAGISHLEQDGAWVPDRARTPREYLRLMSGGNQKLPALKALTRQFEVTWYGQRPAAAADFDQTVARLEELGCR
jgi:Domain of unknown function (DUF4129)